MWGVVEDGGPEYGKTIDARWLGRDQYCKTYRCPICASLDKRLNDFGAATICSLGEYHAGGRAGEWASGCAGEWVDSQAAAGQ